MKVENGKAICTDGVRVHCATIGDGVPDGFYWPPDYLPDEGYIELKKATKDGRKFPDILSGVHFTNEHEVQICLHASFLKDAIEAVEGWDKVVLRIHNYKDPIEVFAFDQYGECCYSLIAPRFDDSISKLLDNLPDPLHLRKQQKK